MICGCVLILTACEKPEEEKRISDPLANDNINQFVVKGSDWKQIVKDKTQFVLGEADSEPYETYLYPPNPIYKYVRYKQSYGTFPAIDGSTVCVPMAAEFVWQFTNISDVLPYEWNTETMTFLSFSTTSGAYNKIIYGGTTNGVISKPVSNLETKEYHFSKRPDIVLATYPSTAELSMAANIGVELIIEPVCYDSFVFITH